MKKNKDEQTDGFESPKWRHAGGKLLERGADKLSSAELLAILIGTGVKGKSAEKIGEDIIARFSSFKGMANQPMHKFLKMRGIGEVKFVRIAAAFEIARRIVNEVLKEEKEYETQAGNSGTSQSV